MLKETIARRYSAALFAVAVEANSVDGIVRELDAVVAALAAEPTAAEFFSSPVIDRARKIEILDDALRAKVGELVLNFLVLLVRKRREQLLPVVARQMHELLDKGAGRSPALIATPTPLEPQELAALANRLSHVYKRTIVPEPRVSPDLLGGVIVQVGDRYVDASVAGKLEEVRRHLLASVETAGD